MLRIKDIEDAVFNHKELPLRESDILRVEQSYSFLKEFGADKVIYGINTGFGPMAQYRIDDDQLRELQYNIIRSHACGAGSPLDVKYVKAAMLARRETFLQGRSGVHPELVKLLSEFIDRDICPVIPQHGSVGASGDLVQLAHLALALIGEGEVFYRGERTEAKKVLEAEKLKPVPMYIREGLAVTNGTSVMTGIGTVNLIYAKRLLARAIAASVMMNEIAASYDDFMSEELNGTKHHPGQNRIAEIMRRTADGGKCMKNRETTMYGGKNSEKIFRHKLQPFYSLRCVPQILGPVSDTLDAVETVLMNELNSADDNPIVDHETGGVYHGGNFHGDYVSFEMDKLKIAVTKLTMLAERQMNYLLHDKLNEMLPPFLNMGTLGLNYGLQALQFTATSTTAESQMLSNPMYVHSIPNNNDNQDIVSMGTNSALIAARVVDNAFQVMAIHFMALAQAADCLGIKDRMCRSSQKIYGDIRNMSAPFMKEDMPRHKDIADVVEYLKNSGTEEQAP